MSHYYNEIDPYCAAWLHNLMDAGQIPHGVIDTRSIEDVRPDELAGFVQCHFFAGIAGWPLALALAGWPSSRPVWTGSCPCQPFSAAGKGAGFADQRHLWPAWFHLISQCRPAVVFGEQVASKDADAWIDLVHADLEGLGYAFGCEPFPSAGVGAPHIRDRNYWVADALGGGLQGPSWSCDAQEQRTSERGVLVRMANADGRHTGAERQQCGGKQRQQPQDGSAGRMGYADRAGSLPGKFAAEATGHRSTTVADGGIRRMADANVIACGQGGAFNGGRNQGSDARAWPGLGGNGMSGGVHVPGEVRLRKPRTSIGCGTREHGVSDSQSFATPSTRLPDSQWSGPTNGFWRDADWLRCTDGKWRPVEPGTFPLAHGIPNRVGRLRAYGNAINPWQAAEFIRAFAEARGLMLPAIEVAA